MNKTVKIILIFFLALIALFLLYPYIISQQNRSSTKNKMLVGVHYYFDQTSDLSDLDEIKSVGFSIIRIDARYDTANMIATEQCLVKAKSLGLKVISVLYYDSNLNNVELYVSRFSLLIDYYQILNEIDIMKWPSGNLYMDDEVIMMMHKLIEVVHRCAPSAETLTTVTGGYMLRIPLIQRAAKMVDYIGIDIYNEAYYTADHLITYLKSLTGKEVWVTEFGSADPDEQKQSEFIINCLNKFERLNVPVALIYSWNQSLQAIKGRQAEKDVESWLKR